MITSRILDGDGWTILTPAADTRVHYVSNAGDDDTAEPVIASEAVFDPFQRLRPYRTAKAAIAAAREGYPDWVLFERGGRWFEGIAAKSGRSELAPFVLGAYGWAPQDPEFWHGAAPGLKFPSSRLHDVAVCGLSFYNHTKDPDSPLFVEPFGSNLGVAVSKEPAGRGVLIEGCRFRFSQLTMQGRPRGLLRDVTIRRCVLLDNYAPAGTWTSNGFAYGIDGLLLEDNVCDHGGWYSGPRVLDYGGATMFCQGVYLSDCNNVIARGNIFTRSSAIGLKVRAEVTGGCVAPVVENNLFVEGEIGVKIGGNSEEPRKFLDAVVRNNVCLHIGRTRPTGRTLGYGIELLHAERGLIEGNLFAHTGSEASGVRNVCAVHVGGTAPGVTVRRNIASDVYSRKPIWQFDDNDDREGFESYDNATNAGGYVDQGRSLEGYQASLGSPATFAAFIAGVRGQSRTNWRREYTAAAVNEWIRAGFEKRPEPALAGSNG